MQSLILGILNTIRCDVFYAIILMCATLDGNMTCVEARDDYGPYAEQVECKQRIREMVSEINSQIEDVVFVDYKCMEVKGLRS